MTLIKPTDKYQGAQVIINSDRLVFNAKNDSILLYSDKAIGFNTKGSIYFDTGASIENDCKVVVNSPKIYLGLKKNIDNETLPTERVVLGNSLRVWLNKLLDEMIEILDMINGEIGYADSTGEPTTAIEDNATVIALRKDDLETLRDDLSVDNDNELVDPQRCTFLSNTIFLADKESDK